MSGGNFQHPEFEFLVCVCKPFLYFWAEACNNLNNKSIELVACCLWDQTLDGSQHTLKYKAAGNTLGGQNQSNNQKKDDKSNFSHQESGGYKPKQFKTTPIQWKSRQYVPHVEHEVEGGHGHEEPVGSLPAYIWKKASRKQRWAIQFGYRRWQGSSKGSSKKSKSDDVICSLIHKCELIEQDQLRTAKGQS